MTEPQRPLLPRLAPSPLDASVEGDGTLLAADKFDVHTWFEAYLAEKHDEALALPGVPFH